MVSMPYLVKNVLREFLYKRCFIYFSHLLFTDKLAIMSSFSLITMETMLKLFFQFV